MSDTNDLLHEIDGAVARVTFNRPEARNAMTFAMYEGLAAICRDMPSDGSIKAMIVTGAGDKAFAAGTDMTQFRGFATPEDAWGYEARMEEVLGTIERCPVPTIAAINGACTGGGAAIALACDLRLCTNSLKFGFPIARTLGNCLSIANLARLSTLIGSARVSELIFTSRLIEAEEARTLGLVSQVLEDKPALDEAASALASKLAGHAPLTMRATKEALRRLRDAQTKLDDHDLVALCYMSDDFKEGMEAFLAKRRPQWKGR